MYCNACGTYSTTGHSCAVGHPAAGVATVATPTATPAGWYPDPVVLRWWDGAAWTEHVAATAQPERFDPYRTHSQSPHGHFLGAIPRTSGRKGRFDVLVFERALVLAKVSGPDPALLGFLVGMFTFSGIIGYVVGDYIGASLNASRIAALASRRPEDIAAAHKHNALVPVGAVQSCAVVANGRVSGRLDLRTTSGMRHKRRWTRPHTRAVDAAALLERSLQTAASVRRRSAVWAYVPLLAVVSVVVLLLLALALPTFLGARERAHARSTTISAARATVAGVCGPYLDMVRRADEGTPPSQEELIAIVDPMVQPFSTAAGQDQSFAPARDAAIELSQLLRQPAETVSGERVSYLAGTLAATCPA